MIYVYLLKSSKDGHYYIGQTENVVRRLHEHNSGYEQSTHHRAPFRLVGYEIYTTREEVRWREYTLKKSAHQRKKFIQKF